MKGWAISMGVKDISEGVRGSEGSRKVSGVKGRIDARIQGSEGDVLEFQKKGVKVTRIGCGSEGALCDFRGSEGLFRRSKQGSEGAARNTLGVKETRSRKWE